MKHTPEGLLNCARIAIYADHDIKKHIPWFEFNGRVISKEKLHCENEPHIEFTLDNDSDVLALLTGLADKRMGVSPSKIDGKTVWRYKQFMKIAGSEEYETLTDCLYAAAQEVEK